MKKITSFALLAAMLVLSPAAFAGNWVYDTNASKWVKNITPEIIQFNKQTTSSVQSSIVVNGGTANPNPVLNTASLTTLGATNGYFVVTGGQITSSTVAANVTKGFAIPDTAMFKKTLRFAAASSTVTDGFKIGVTGYVNLSWYVPTIYNRSTYKFQVIDSVYTSAAVNVGMTIYDESAATVQFTNYDVATPSNSQPSAGWRSYTYTQGQNNGTFVPFRIKLSLPNTTNLVAYITTPKFLLTSTTEPALRTVTVQTTADGTVTPAYGNLHDQDVEVFTIAPVTGKTIDVVTYNGTPVTPVAEGAVYKYTTPLLTADATLEVTYKDAIPTALATAQVPSAAISVNGSLLNVQGMAAGQQICVFSAAGKLMHRSISSQSAFSIKLPKGVYVLNIAGKVSKVVL